MTNGTVHLFHNTNPIQTYFGLRDPMRTMLVMVRYNNFHHCYTLCLVPVADLLNGKSEGNDFQAYASTYTCTVHTQTNIVIYSNICIHINVEPHNIAHTCTYTYTHTHTCMCVPLFIFIIVMFS